jgi:hypothetical protein
MQNTDLKSKKQKDMNVEGELLRETSGRGTRQDDGDKHNQSTLCTCMKMP